MEYRSYLLSLILISVVIATLSCNSGDTVGSGEGDGRSCSPFDAPFPCAVGSEWSYRFGDTDMKLVAAGMVNHTTVGEVVVIEEWFRSDDNKDWYLSSYEYVQVTDEEIRRYDDLNEDSYSVLVTLPLELGNTWSYRPLDHPDWTASIVSIDNVSMPWGTYTGCYRVEYITEDSYWGDSVSTRWFAPGVGGLYGVREEDGRITELVGYKFPEEQVLTASTAQCVLGSG
ncbi:MAG: hypothetical protein GY771_08175 [bacterium]|nr:hypothetical protein [bacterium]